MQDTFGLAVLGMIVGVILMEIVYANEPRAVPPRRNLGGGFEPVSQGDLTRPVKHRMPRPRNARGILGIFSHTSHQHTVPGKHV
jgi:hypothetical protein